MVMNYSSFTRISLALLLLLFFTAGNAIIPVKKETVKTVEPIEIRIGTEHDVLQGHYSPFAITLNANIDRLDGFDLLLSYNPDELTLRHALPGRLLLDNNWEYFSYQIFGDTANDSLAFVNIMAAADIPNVDPSLPDSAQLAGGFVELYMYISNDRTHECMFLPLRFFWRDCEDNLLFLAQGDTIALSRSVTEDPREIYGRAPIPEWPEPPDGCLDSLTQVPVPMVDFVNGGFEIVCAGSRPDMTGDLNCNGLSFELADAILYSQLLTSGIEILNPDIAPCCISTSDVNKDGITLTASDLQRLVRIFNGSAEPYPKPLENLFLTVDTMTYFDRLKVYCSSDEHIGATLFTFTVNDTTALPSLEQAASDMDLEYAYRNDTLKVLIYSFGTSMIPAGTGAVLTIPTSISPVLIAVDAAEFQGWLMKADF